VHLRVCANRRARRAQEEGEMWALSSSLFSGAEGH
jgi:hypothetical protein